MYPIFTAVAIIIKCICSNTEPQTYVNDCLIQLTQTHTHIHFCQSIYIYIYIYIYSPGSNTSQDTNCTATCPLSRKLFKLDEPDMQDTAGEAEMNS